MIKILSELEMDFDGKLITDKHLDFPIIVSKGAKIKKRYNQVPHPT